MPNIRPDYLACLSGYSAQPDLVNIVSILSKYAMCRHTEDFFFSGFYFCEEEISGGDVGNRGDKWWEVPMVNVKQVDSR